MTCRMAANYPAYDLSRSRRSFLRVAPDGRHRVPDHPARILSYSRRGFLPVVTDNYSFNRLIITDIEGEGTRPQTVTTTAVTASTPPECI
jgi:hypothetical protein